MTAILATAASAAGASHVGSGAVLTLVLPLGLLVVVLAWMVWFLPRLWH